MAQNSGRIRFVVEVQGDQAAKQYQALENQLQRLQREQSNFAKGSKEYAENIKQQQALRKELKQLEPTYEALTKRKRALEKQLKRLTPGTEAYIAAQRELAEVVPLWQRQRDAIRNVGRAQESTAKSGNIFKRVLGGVGKVVTAMLGPIGMVIGTLGALAAAFGGTEEGGKLLRQGMALLQSITAAVTRQVNAFLQRLKDIKTLEDFGKMLRDNIELRLTAAITAVRGFGAAIGKLLKGDFDGAREAANEATTALASFVTGLDQDTIKEETKKIQENTKEQLRFANARRGMARTVAALNLEITKLAAKEQLLNTQADDPTRSLEERYALSVQALEVAEQRAAQEVKLAKAQAGIIAQEMALRKQAGMDVNDLLASQLDAANAVQAAELALQQLREENAITQRELQSDLIEQRLDVLIDGYDFEKTINERRLKDDQLNAVARKMIFEEITAAGKRSFLEQIATIQQGTDQLIDAQELLGITDAVVLADRIRGLGLSEVLSTRLLEIVKERRIAIQDLHETEREAIGEIEPLKARQHESEMERIKREADAMAQKQEAEIERERKNEAERAAMDEARRQRFESTLRGMTSASDSFFQSQIEWLGRDDEARKRNAETIKRLQRLKVVTALPAEIAGYWSSSASLPFPFGQIVAGLQTAAAIARARKNIADINAQSFAVGGFTGKSTAPRDSSGERPVGVVHEDEWVAPRWMANHPAYGQTIAALEAVRSRGFAAGGYTTLSAMPTPNANIGASIGGGMARELRDLLQQREPLRAYVVYDQFETKREEITAARTAASI